MSDTSLPAVEATIGTVMPAITLRRMGALMLKTWPFIRPMLKHLILFMAVGLVASIIFSGTALLAQDLFSNKVLVGNKLQPLQAALLLLDDTYVTTGADGETMNATQRKVVRDLLVAWFAVGAVVGLTLLALLGYYGTWIWHCINQNLRVAMIERAEHLSLKYHSHARVGDAIFRVYQDSSMIINVVEQGIVAPIVTLYAILLALAFIAFFDPMVAFMCIVVAVPMVWLTVLFTPRIRQRAWKNRRAASDLTSRLQESFSAIKIVKANRAEQRIWRRFDQDSYRALDAAFYLRLEIIALTLLVMTIGGITMIALEYVMVNWVIEERETFLGALVVAFIGFSIWNLGAFQHATGYVSETMRSSFNFMRLWTRLQDLFMGLERAFFFIDLQPEVADPDNSIAFPSPIESVDWQDIDFSYATDRIVLQSLDLTAKAGAITAIVGTTGSGKSTLMSLLLRLYDPDRGSVLLNDVNLKDLKVDDIRHNMAIALQKNVLFATSVAENIGYAGDYNREQIKVAARIACADDFINEMPDGYDTELGERGGKLSSGQRQRLSIARAIIRDTPILILDEPTASLDAETEHQVLENLAEWGTDRVVFIITHRLSTIRSTDRIAFLEDGRIVEYGAHDDLMALAGGRYRRFVEAETHGTDA